MTRPTPPVAPHPAPVHPLPPAAHGRPAPPAEPTEVLGRHGNTGQKDHKGAR